MVLNNQLQRVSIHGRFPFVTIRFALDNAYFRSSMLKVESRNTIVPDISYSPHKSHLIRSPSKSGSVTSLAEPVQTGPFISNSK